MDSIALFTRLPCEENLTQNEQHIRVFCQAELFAER